MNASQFMDKQIMDLSSSQSKDFIDLIDPREHGVSTKKEEVFPSYDFQNILPSGSSQPCDADTKNNGGTGTWSSDDPKSISSNLRKSNSLGSSEFVKIAGDKDHNHAAIVGEIDGIMKKHADNLLHVLEGVGARLLKLENSTYHLEVSVDDLKASIGHSYGTTDGKMRQLENIMREVKGGVDIVKDKQDIIEAQLNLAKLQIQHQETPNSNHVDQHQPPIPQKPNPPHVPLLNSFPFPTPPTVLQPPFPNTSQQEPYFSSPPQRPEIPNPQFPLPVSYQAPPQQLQKSAPAASQLQLPVGRHAEDTPQYGTPHNYLPSPQNYSPSSQNHPPATRQSPSHSFNTGPPSQQFYNPPSDPYNEASQYGGGSTRSNLTQPPTIPHPSSGSGYPNLPTARMLPHMPPVASAISPALGSSSSENRVPLDDVVEKVSGMGFVREHVRATVQKLTENGRAVDLNVVLDSLTSDRGLRQQTNWFGR